MKYFLNQMILIFFHFIGPNTHLREKNHPSAQMLKQPWMNGEGLDEGAEKLHWLLAASSPCGVMRMVEPSRSMTGSMSSPELTVMGHVLLQAGGR